MSIARKYTDPSSAQIYRDYNRVHYYQGSRFIDEYGHLIKGPVLDAGCGTGELTSYVAGKFLVEVMGFDNSQERITLASSTYRTVAFTVADAVTLTTTPGLRGSEFATIVSFNALHHIPKPFHPAVFSEMKKMMTIDGVALLLIPEGGSGINAVLQETAAATKWLPLFADFDLSKVRSQESKEYYLDQLEAAGFYRIEAKSNKEDGRKELNINEMIDFLHGWVPPHLVHLKMQDQPKAVQTDFLNDAVHLYFYKNGKRPDEKVMPSVIQNKIVAYSTHLAFFSRAVPKKSTDGIEVRIARTAMAKL